MNQPLSFWTGFIMLVFIIFLLVYMWLPGSALQTNSQVNKPILSLVLIAYALYRSIRLYKLLKR